MPPESAPAGIDHETQREQIVRGTYKGREGRINTSNRKNFRVFVEGVSRDKGNGATVPIPVSASNVVITKIKMDKDRTALLKRKSTKKGEDVEMKVRSASARALLCPEPLADHPCVFLRLALCSKPFPMGCNGFGASSLFLRFPVSLVRLSRLRHRAIASFCLL